MQYAKKDVDKLTRDSIQRDIEKKQAQLKKLKDELEQRNGNLKKMQNARTDLENLKSDFEKEFFDPYSQINKLIGMDPLGLEGVKFLQDTCVKMSYLGQYSYNLSNRVDLGLENLRKKIDAENEKIGRCKGSITTTKDDIKRLEIAYNNAPL